MTDVTPDSVGLVWTVPEGEFDSFVVQYKDRDGQPQVVPVAADQREVTITGLEPSRKYKFLLFGVQDGRRHSQVSVEAKTGEDCVTLCFPKVSELPASCLPCSPSPVQIRPGPNRAGSQILSFICSACWAFSRRWAMGVWGLLRGVKVARSLSCPPGPGATVTA